MVLVGLFFCVGDEENGHHACMNGHLTTAHQPQDVSWGCVGESATKSWGAWSCGEKAIRGLEIMVGRRERL